MFQFFPSTFWTLCLFVIVFFHAEDSCKFLVAFRTMIIVARHPISLLSLSFRRPRPSKILVSFKYSEDIPPPFPIPKRLCRNYYSVTLELVSGSCNSLILLDAEPILNQVQHKVRQHFFCFFNFYESIKAEEPDCLFRRNLPSLMITTQSPRGVRAGNTTKNIRV